MVSLLDYIFYSNESFTEKPFNHVDGAVFSLLAYLTLEASNQVENIVCDKTKAPSFKDFFTYTDNDMQLLGDSFLMDAADPKEVIVAFRNSKRFGNAKVVGYKSITDKDAQVQFSATVFDLDNNTRVIAYRGTDGSFTGWKEDFNTACTPIVESDLLAAEFLNIYANEYLNPADNLIVLGQSKGGRLAESAALFCERKNYLNIDRVYSFDGPAYLDKTVAPRIETLHYKSILYKLVPEFSVFGMILEDRNNFQIMESNGNPIMQHSPLNWHVNAEKDDFLYKETLLSPALAINYGLMKSLNSLTLDERTIYADTVYDLLTMDGLSNVHTVSENVLANFIQIANNLKSLPEDVQKLIVLTTIHIAAQTAEGISESSKQLLLETIKTNTPDLNLSEVGKYFKAIDTQALSSKIDMVKKIARKNEEQLHAAPLAEKLANVKDSIKSSIDEKFKAN